MARLRLTLYALGDAQGFAYSCGGFAGVAESVDATDLGQT